MWTPSRARRPDPHRAVAGRRLAIDVRRPEPRRRRDAVAERELVAHRDRRERPMPLATARTVATTSPRTSRRRRIGGLAEPAPGDPEAGEQARPDQRQHPRVGRLDRRQEGLDAARAELAGHVRDRRDEDEERAGSEPDHRRERRVAAGDRRPDDAGEGDEGRARARRSRRATSIGPPGR